jgi:hypothetical protein
MTNFSRMKRRLAEITLILGAIAVGSVFITGRQIPELDWSLGKGQLRIDGISIGMSTKQAYAAMGESGGETMEHVYSSEDGRTLFLGGSSVMEVASFDCICLPDGQKIQAGDPIRKLASLWPVRLRTEKQGLVPLTIKLTDNGSWYEGAGELWVYANKEEKIEYFDLSQVAANAMGGPTFEKSHNSLPP